jgi:hypothetical protein
MNSRLSKHAYPGESSFIESSSHPSTSNSTENNSPLFLVCTCLLIAMPQAITKDAIESRDQCIYHAELKLHN